MASENFLVSECVVSLFNGMGGSTGLGGADGGCADAVLKPVGDPNKNTNAITGSKGFNFLFIADFFVMIFVSEIVYCYASL